MTTTILPFVYISIWSASIYLLTEGANLYPFGTAEGDEVVPRRKDYGVGLSKQDFEFPFLGRNTGYIYIANNGYIAFTKEGHGLKSPRSWNNPNPKWPEEPDPCILAPYYAENHLTSMDATEPGSVFYRVLSAAEPKEQEYIRNMTQELEDNMVTAKYFIASKALVVTWFNLTFSGHFCAGQAGCPPRNTFQAILLTDSKDSYVIFKYAQLTWLGGPSYGGDTATGLGVTYFPQAGFNAGDGIGWYSLPKSGTEDILNLANMEGSNTESGTFYYKVSDDEVVPGGCLGSSDKAGLVAFPRHGPMLGGQIVELSGPCYRPRGQFVCKFDDHVVVKGEFVSRVKVRCVQPMFMKIGVISLELSTNGGKQFEYRTTYNLDQLSRSSSSAVTIGPDFDWENMDSASVSLTWPKREATTNPTGLVNVKLFGYSHKTPTPFTELEVLASRVNNTGNFTFKPSEHRCHGEKCLKYQLGILQVSMSCTDEELQPKLWSYVLPLGWYVGQALGERLGTNWPQQECQAWNREDRQSMEWLDELDSCPCHVNQAAADFGRWRTAYKCNMYLGTPCKFHDDAIHCIRSTKPHKKSGAGNQCCYGKDGLVMYAEDSDYGSTPDRATGIGTKPYGRHPYIPVISHWVLDVVTFFHCCLWSKGSCSLYMDQRPTKDCKEYVPPQQGVIFGSTHLIRFDGNQQYFHETGDFWLAKTNRGNFRKDLEIQARLEQAIVAGLPTNATAVTAIAMRDGPSSVVEVRLREEGRNQIRKVDVIVDGIKQYFDVDWQQLKTFYDVRIMRNEYINITHSNFTVMFDSGVGVQVAAHDGLLYSVVSMPSSYKGKVDGLLGAWGNKEDNVHTYHITDIAVDDNTSATNQLVGSHWAVEADQALFSKRSGKTYKSQVNPVLHPRGDTSITSGVRDEDIQALCDNNTACTIDYRTTGNRQIAVNTKMASDWFKIFREYTKPIPYCGLLDVKHSLKNNYNYSIGSKVRITGCRNGLHLVGQRREYECVMAGNVPKWTPNNTARCSSYVSKSPSAAYNDSASNHVSVYTLCFMVAFAVMLSRRMGH